MPPRRRDPRFSFVVEVDGSAPMPVAECSGLGAEVEVIEFREGGEGSTTTRHLPGSRLRSDVILTRAFTADRTMWDWMTATLDGSVDRRNVTIRMIDEKGKSLAAFLLQSAWPCRYQAPVLTADGNEVAVETLTLIYDGLEIS